MQDDWPHTASSMRSPHLQFTAIRNFNRSIKHIGNSDGYSLAVVAWVTLLIGSAVNRPLALRHVLAKAVFLVGSFAESASSGYPLSRGTHGDCV